jgi:hypothetical protein
MLPITTPLVLFALGKLAFLFWFSLEINLVEMNSWEIYLIGQRVEKWNHILFLQSIPYKEEIKLNQKL